MTSRRTALVIGASGGIGSAIARALVADEFDVALTARFNPDKVSALAVELRMAGAHVVCAAVDVTDAAACVTMVGDAAAALDGLDAVVLASGPYIDMLHVSRINADQLRSQLDTDVVGAFNVCRAALPTLRASRGVFIALTTPATERAAKRDLLSALPKAAVEQLVRHVAVEEGRFGVRANCVAVGPIADGMYDRLVADGYFTAEWLEAAEAHLALGRLGSADDIAHAVAFLASARATWITGQTLCVDGGYAL
jgi:3-oxoacyl-[acyl-carrier protein] reductase